MGIAEPVQVMNITATADGKIILSSDSDELTVANVSKMLLEVFEMGVSIPNILTELKIMNTHLSIITDNLIGEEDVN